MEKVEQRYGRVRRYFNVIGRVDQQWLLRLRQAGTSTEPTDRHVTGQEGRNLDGCTVSSSTYLGIRITCRLI